jgi:ferredoxin-NADP reductase
MPAPAPTPGGFASQLLGRKEVAERTAAFYFEKPSGWTFKPGQSIDLTLVNPLETDAEGNRRALSIASHPGEGTLMIATRLRDTAFKRVLASMPIGTAVKIEGPFGNLTLHNNSARAAVILTGGIGITPFRSMIFHAAEEKLPHKIFLFYSNRRPEDAAFLDELLALQKENPQFKLVPTMSEMQKSRRPWQGETGFINEGMLSRHCGPLSQPIYYIAGPPGMVSAFHKMLNGKGVDDDDIRTEDFSGY